MAEIESLLNDLKATSTRILFASGKERPKISLNIQASVKELRSAFDILRDELESAQAALDDLRGENDSLREELASRPRAGRRPTYSHEERAQIAAYRDQHSYRETRERYGISGDTLNRILRECRQML